MILRNEPHKAYSHKYASQIVILSGAKHLALGYRRSFAALRMTKISYIDQNERIG